MAEYDVADVPVANMVARALGVDESAGYECRVRMADQTLGKTGISPAKVAAILGVKRNAPVARKPAKPEKPHLLVESTRIRLVCTHSRQFAVGLSGTLFDMGRES